MANVTLATRSLFNDLKKNIEDCQKGIVKHDEMLDAQLEFIRKLHSDDKMFTSIIADIINVQRKHMREIKLLKGFLLLNFIILAAVFGVLMLITLEVL